MAYLLTLLDCPFIHPTCPRFCDLYSSTSRCDLCGLEALVENEPRLADCSCCIGSRLLTYEPLIANYGEVIGEGADPSNPAYFPILRVRSYHGSYAHVVFVLGPTVQRPA